MTDTDHQAEPAGLEAWASDDPNPPDRDAWDLLIIGGGTAGLVAARTAAAFGASVLLIERSRTGGDCLWTGCVPSKALLAAAHAAAAARGADRFGIHVPEVRVDFGEVMRHVRRAVSLIEPDDAPVSLRAAHVRVVHGVAMLTAPDSVSLRVAGGVSPVQLRFRQMLLATGSKPSLPPIPGLTAAGPLTSDNVWELTHLPARLLVLGGGSIGCELGQAFARLGAGVTIAEAAPNLLPREDPHAAALLREALTEDGVTVHAGTAVAEIIRTEDGWSAALTDGRTIGFDRVLVAVGRTPDTRDLGLETAGVDVDERGHIRVDPHLRTSNPRVWAAGDVTGYPEFTHVAGVHGSLAASNAVLGLRRSVDTRSIPRVTFTQPEVAAVGIGPHDADGSGFTVHTIDHEQVDRAVAEDERRGVTRIVLDRKGRVVGTTIVGPRAGESLAELVLAIKNGLRARDLAATLHAYPTYGDGPWKAGIAQVQDQLSRPLVRFVTRRLLKHRRRRAIR